MITAAEKRVGRPPRMAFEREVEEPAVLPSRVRRWTVADCDTWILSRLAYQWGGSDAQWLSKLIGFANSNDHLFVTNGEAVLLAFILRHPMTGKPVVVEVFGWGRAAEPVNGNFVSMGQAEAPILALYRHMREWAKAMGAPRMDVGICSDIQPHSLREMFKGVSYFYVAGAP